MDAKKCKICGEVKPLNEFSTYSASGYSGYRGECRLCNNARWRAARKAHKNRYYDENMNGYADHAKENAKKTYTGNKAAYYERNAEYKRRHPERAEALKLVTAAIRSGDLVPGPCEVCQQAAQAHHDDYTQPLVVRWLCRKHHMALHRALHRKQVSASLGGAK
jgi:hypothetical protein